MDDNNNSNKNQFPQNLKQLTAISMLIPFLIFFITMFVQLINAYRSAFYAVAACIFAWGFIPITIQNYRKLIKKFDIPPNRKWLVFQIVYQSLLLIPTTYFFIKFITSMFQGM